MRVLFMGTPAYAVPALEAVAGRHEIVGVVTRVDKPNRRGNKIAFSPVKEWALAHEVPVFQPESMKDPSLAVELAALAPDVGVVVAFGMMIPEDIINLPRHKTINIHGSLLPRYRGAAPMQYAVLNGDADAGVSIMYITPELDAGDVILSRSLAVGEDETFGELHDRLAVLGAEALMDALDLIACGGVCAVPQDGASATFAPSITKEECVIDWTLPAGMVHNRIRGLSPAPCANTRLPDGKRLLVYRSGRVSAGYAGQPGEVVDVIKKKGPVVMTGAGAVCILSAKPEGKREMPGFELVNGHYLAVGDRLG
ncbi:methionyl-tRNA formyltransferase [Methanocorpusculum vombati]|uniref:methionyl-tRNA formyltransferase n=1 Tax=Methanocorpusculum vombati TaxID=3002864 RepID=A0ABT4ILF3_9EURY|nr:methionyl-tRNA formyltransferase [Methanocorpusculum vombati]MCZ9318834.1 methionyl-tRNA formyltransferase [Methanocorpusculum sp.]MCZ0862571.1 methionyl-tRNA formyltransferase [Methanocorpusculum vombati]MDE2533962.1 methionyl-tRNA formyltransferase [Methanocorpusculum sp.]MDE2546144.1 methionyl-tRNA formyltransferase [Methanocorpusculum sp.]MDE2548082.1 methionyl-tRNA formyltransferase [Methanocorpusculum sp.]